MELHGVGGLALDLEGGVHHIGRGGNDLAALGKGRNAVSVGHPHLGLGLHALEERAFGHHLKHGAAILAGVGGFHLSAAGVGQVLGAVADAKQGQLAAEQAQVHLRGVGVTHAAGTAGKDDAFHGLVHSRDLVVGIYFAIDVELSEAAADQLRNLGAKVQNDNLIHCGSS